MTTKRFAVALSRSTFHRGESVRVVKVYASSYTEARAIAASNNHGWTPVRATNPMPYGGRGGTP